MAEDVPLRAAIEALENLRGELGEQAVDLATSVLRDRLAGEAGPAPADTQRKQVTVLFADVQGFTALAERQDPEVVRDVMNAIWARLDAVLLAEGGVIDKHIGDAVMALFGVPTARDDDPERAVRAGLALQAALREVAAENREVAPGGLQMRVGIHTGPVVFGAVGTTGERTAMGDTVNVASRLEHAAPVGRVLVSHDTWVGVRKRFEALPRPATALRGKAEPVRTHLVVAERLDRDGREPASLTLEDPTPFVGRRAAMAVLEDAADAVFEERRLRYLTISGPAGIGKSRLLLEFERRLQAQGRDYERYYGRVAVRASNAPYQILRDQIFRRYRIRESDTPEVAREKLTARLRAALGPSAEAAGAIVGQLAGFEMSDHPAVAAISGDPRRFREVAYRTVLQMIYANTLARPAVMIVEDLQWADDASLDLVSWLPEAGDVFPVLVVHSFRPTFAERRPDWASVVQRHTGIELGPLAAPAAGELVDALVSRVRDFPGELRQRLVDTAEGNPFFLEELVEKLFDDGVVVRDGEAWRVDPRRLATLSVPTTLTAVLQARLDGLARIERSTAQRAAVVGREFWDGALRALDDGAGDVESVLETLEQRDLVEGHDVSSVVGATEYSFRSAMLRDVAYESVLLKDRRVFHERAARWLEAQEKTMVGASAASIAAHWDRAGEAVRAARWRIEAGKAARAIAALEDAEQELDRAQRALQGKPGEEGTRLEALGLLGEVRRARGRFDAALDAYEAQGEVAASLGDLAAQAQAAGARAATLRTAARYEAAIAAAAAAAELARQAGDLEAHGAALVEWGWALAWTGDPARAEALGEEALESLTRAGGARAAARARRLLGNLALVRCDYATARQHLEQALATWQAAGDRFQEALLLNDYGELFRLRGEYRQAATLYGQARERFVAVADRAREQLATVNLAGCHAAIGEAAAALADLDRVARQVDGGWYAMGELRQHQAVALCHEGRLDEAADAAEQAVALGRAGDSAEDLAPALRLRGEVATARLEAGAPAPAETRETVVGWFEEALAVAAGRGMRGEHARARRAFARYQAAAGDGAEARRLWAAAREDLEELGLEAELARMPSAPG